MNILDVLHMLGWKIICADNYKKIYVITQTSETSARTSRSGGNLYRHD